AALGSQILHEAARNQQVAQVAGGVHEQKAFRGRRHSGLHWWGSTVTAVLAMHDSAPLHPRTIRSFVKRTGRMTTAQRQALDEHWPRYGLSLADGAPDFDQVFGRRAPRVFEIGFGMGDSLAAMAAANPGFDYIGVEVHSPGVGNLLKLASAAGLDNLRVYEADAKDVLQQAVADGSLDRIQIFFPD